MSKKKHLSHDGVKRCKRCGLLQPFENFDLAGTGYTERRALCKSCHREVHRARRSGRATRKGRTEVRYAASM